MSQEIMNYKYLWTEMFKYLDVNDYMNLELSNKVIRNQILNYYQMNTKNIKIDNSEKNKLKKVFLSKYMNSFVIFNAHYEFDNLDVTKTQNNNGEEKEDYRNLHEKDKEMNKKNGKSNVCRFNDNSMMSYSSSENSMFCYK